MTSLGTQIMLPTQFVYFLEQIWCYENYYIITMGCKNEIYEFLAHKCDCWYFIQILNVQIWIVRIYDFLGVVLWALIIQGSKFHSKKVVTGPRVSVSSQYKKDNRCLPTCPDPTTNKCDAGSLTIVANDTGPHVNVIKPTYVSNDYPLSLMRSNSSQQISSSSQ
jgi:hypothetical protein